MSQQGKSSPKMRRAFTPRVKSAQNIYSIQPAKTIYFTDKKQHQNTPINPQTMQHHLAKKLNLNSSPQKVGNFEIPTNKANINSPIKKMNHLAGYRPIKLNIQQPIKSKELGRNIIWPANDKKIMSINLQEDKKEGKISRCMSAHTIKSTYPPKSLKSDEIKERRKQFEQKFGVAFNYLLSQNTNYLNERLSLCNQKSRPREQIFSVERPSMLTTNRDFYKKNSDKHQLNISPQNQKMSLLLRQTKVCGNSTSQEFHKGKYGQKADLATWPQGFKLEGPICNVTTSSNAFPNHGEYEKMVPIAVWNEHPLGLKHRQCSTNSRLMKGDFAPRSDLATWNNLNPVANDLFNPQKSTKYQKEFGQKQKQPIQQWPMPDHKLITTDGKFTTEMKSTLIDFNSHELNGQNKCKCGRKKH